jgi:hypothetical protein
MTITLDTRLSQLWESYPATREHWDDWAPAFARLTNAAMRETVAKSTSIEQAANLSGLHPGELLARIRTVTGDARDPSLPDWLREENITDRIDADSMLATGVHPVGLVRQKCAALAPGALLELKSSFRPDPLIELMKREGCQVHCFEPSPGRHATYFMRT